MYWTFMIPSYYKFNIRLVCSQFILGFAEVCSHSFPLALFEHFTLLSKDNKGTVLRKCLLWGCVAAFSPESEKRINCSHFYSHFFHYANILRTTETTKFICKNLRI